MNPSRSIISSYSKLDVTELDEGLSSIAASKLADLARGFILKARPILILHRFKDNSTITFKLRRGLINHILIQNEEGKGDKQIAKASSAAILLTKTVGLAGKLFTQGYIEI